MFLLTFEMTCTNEFVCLMMPHDIICLKFKCVAALMHGWSGQCAFDTNLIRLLELITQ